MNKSAAVQVVQVDEEAKPTRTLIMEEVTKCCYVDCTDSSEKEQTLHELPVCDTALCIKWLVNSGHVELIGRDFEALRSIKFFICNNHFSEQCYLSKGTLKETAVPFPHWRTRSGILIENGRPPASSKSPQDAKLCNGHPSPAATKSGHGSCFFERKTLQDQLPQESRPAKEKADSSQWCRTCATRKQRRDLISMTTKISPTEMSLLSKLKLLIEIDEEDALPTKMCEECIHKLEQSFKFFQQIYVADNTLRRLFSSVDSVTMPGRRHAISSTDIAGISAMAGMAGTADGSAASTGSLSTPTSRNASAGKPETKTDRNQSGTRVKEDDRTSVQSVGGWEPSNFPSTETVRQTRQSRSDVPRTTRRLVGRPRGSISRLSRSSRLSRVPRGASRAARGSRGWRSRGGQIPKSEEQSPHASSAARNAQGVASWTAVIKEEQAAQQHGRVEEAIDRTRSTVFSLLADTCCSDEELSWNDVVKLMGRQAGFEPKPKVAGTAGPAGAAGAAGAAVHCEFCDAVFQLGKQLQAHLLSHHFRHSDYVCSECGVSCDSEIELTRHSSSWHAKESSFQCDNCQQQFPRKAELSEHVVHCTLSGEGSSSCSVSCDFCNECFPSKTLLRQHLKIAAHSAFPKRKRLDSTEYSSSTRSSSVLTNQHDRRTDSQVTEASRQRLVGEDLSTCVGTEAEAKNRLNS